MADERPDYVIPRGGGVPWPDLRRENHRPPERDLEITDISTMVLQGNFRWGIVKVETNTDVYGIGETHGSGPQGPGYLEGENPLDVDRLVDLRFGAGAGVEMALWDIKGKVLDVPVYELLGGAYRDAVQLYCDTHGGESLGAAQSPDRDPHEVYSPESFARAAREVVDDGFDALKFDLDLPPRGDLDTATGRLDNAEIAHKASVIEAVREEIGYDVDLGVDLHWNFTVETATRMGQALAEYDLAWVEDPVAPRQYDAHRRVREAIEAPLLTGENLRDPGEFYEMLQAEGMDIAAPDANNCGGLGNFRQIAKLCELEGIPVAAHNIDSPVGTVAAAHAAATVPNAISVEYHAHDVPWWGDLVERTGESGPVIQDGSIPLPEGPGLGIEVDPSVAEQYLVDGSSLIF